MKINTFFIFLITSTLISCAKVEESIVDCAGQSLFIDLHHTVSPGRQVNFTVDYSGTGHTLDNTVKWDFDDGTPLQTVSGTSVNHTFTAAGHYTVKAKVSLNHGSCSYEPHEPITLE